MLIELFLQERYKSQIKSNQILLTRNNLLFYIKQTLLWKWTLFLNLIEDHINKKKYGTIPC